VNAEISRLLHEAAEKWMKGSMAHEHRQHKLTPSMPEMSAAIHKKYRSC
jgi:hypothetical protein